MIIRRAFIAGLAAAPLAGPAVAASPFEALFDGRSLKGWTALGGANWAVRDGAITAEGGAGLLMSKESYRDFELVAELWVSEDANSGIFIRCSDRNQVTAANAYEVNVFDKRPDPTYGTGGIVNVAKVSPMPKAGGRWSRMEIIARGDRLSVVFNGQKTVDAVQDSAHAEGPFALQYGSGVVKFRKVEIRAL